MITRKHDPERDAKILRDASDIFDLNRIEIRRRALLYDRANGGSILQFHKLRTIQIESWSAADTGLHLEVSAKKFDQTFDFEVELPWDGFKADPDEFRDFLELTEEIRIARERKDEALKEQMRHDNKILKEAAERALYERLKEKFEM